MKSPKLCVGVVCISNGRVLLVKRRNEPGKGMWSIPGGHVEFGEPIREAARREMLEETGLDVRLLRVIDVVDIFYTDTDGSVKEHFVVVNYEGLVEGGELRASGDSLDVKWIPLHELHNYHVVSSTREFLRRNFTL